MPTLTRSFERRVKYETCCSTKNGMRILTDTQGTALWEVARKGRLTASCIGKILAGKGTKTRRDYINQLVLDLEGIQDFRDSGKWFDDGRKYEAHARGWYQWEHDCKVEETGFVLHDEYNWIGCSPDGFVGDNGNLEIKYRKTLETFETAITKPPPRIYQCQMQTQMWLCDKTWTAYVNYWRNDATGQEQGHVRRIERDAAWIKEIENAAFLFWQAVVAAYRERNGTVQFAYPWDVLKSMKSVDVSSEDAFAEYEKQNGG